jgi:hypothetical protein
MRALLNGSFSRVECSRAASQRTELKHLSKANLIQQMPDKFELSELLSGSMRQCYPDLYCVDIYSQARSLCN